MTYVCCCQILELMEGGNLYSALNGPNHADFFWDAQGQLLAMDIVRGVFYLHGKLICKYTFGVCVRVMAM